MELLLYVFAGAAGITIGLAFAWQLGKWLDDYDA